MSVTTNSASKNSDTMLRNIVKISRAKFISFEVCANREKLNMDLLNELEPHFCSIPWFSDSHTKTKLKDLDQIPAILVAKQLQSHGHVVLLHLAGKGLTKHTALEHLNRIKSNGIRNILALQGDAPLTGENSNECDFPYACDLVKFIRENFKGDFSIGVAGYSEKHPESESFNTDLQRLKEKVDCGADFIITQALFNYEKLEIFHKSCRKIGIDIPIIPGIFIITSLQSLKMMRDVCKVPVPDDVMKFVEDNKDDIESTKTYGIQLAKEISNKILRSTSFQGLHIFTLNHLENVKKLLDELEISKHQ